MHSTLLSTAALVLAGLQFTNAQTSSSCNPATNASCPAEPGVGGTVSFDFTKYSSQADLPVGFSVDAGSNVNFDPTNGMSLTVGSLGGASTVSYDKSFFYGKVEYVMKAARGDGIVSSAITLSKCLDEIDFEFLGTASDDNKVQSNFFKAGNGDNYNREIDLPVSTPFETFHSYVVDWTPDSIKFSVDGTLLRTVIYTTANYTLFPQTPMQVSIGNWVACPSKACFQDTTCDHYWTCQWVGSPFDPNNSPAVMSIKSLTITDYSCGSSYSYKQQACSASAISVSSTASSCTVSTFSSSISTLSSTTATSSSSASQTPGSGGYPAAPFLGGGNTGSTGNTTQYTNATSPSYTQSRSSASVVSGSTNKPTGTQSSMASGMQAQISTSVLAALGFVAIAIIC